MLKKAENSYWAYVSCRLENLSIRWMMGGVWQLMEKFCLEVMAVQHCIWWILIHSRVTYLPLFKHFFFEKSLVALYIFLFYWILHFAFLDAALSKHVVSYKGHQVKYLNELEFVNGEVWANILGVCLNNISFMCKMQTPKFSLCPLFSEVNNFSFSRLTAS